MPKKTDPRARASEKVSGDVDAPSEDPEQRVPGDPDFALDQERDIEKEGEITPGGAYRGDQSVRDPRIPGSEAKRGGDPGHTEPDAPSEPYHGEREVSEKHDTSGGRRKT